MAAFLSHRYDMLGLAPWVEHRDEFAADAEDRVPDHGEVVVMAVSAEAHTLDHTVGHSVQKEQLVIENNDRVALEELNVADEPRVRRRVNRPIVL